VNSNPAPLTPLIRSPKDKLLVTEIFHSLQGEGSLIGIPFVFVRLTGCNLRCTYCDTSYAFKGGTLTDLQTLVKKVADFDTPHVLITGGEPLIHPGTLKLVQLLAKMGFLVSLETHGEFGIEKYAPYCRIIMDIKTPASGMCRGGFEKNLVHLKETDEVKFVIASEQDYFWAKDWVESGKIKTKEILFSPAQIAPAMPGGFSGVSAKWLAENILKDKLSVRFQLQLHKQIWGHQKGV
jgi:7-carboxy-7-deazaguanine synthase